MFGKLPAFILNDEAGRACSRLTVFHFFVWGLYRWWWLASADMTFIPAEDIYLHFGYLEEVLARHLVCSVRWVKGFRWKLILVATEVREGCMSCSQCGVPWHALNIINGVPKCFCLRKIILILAVILNRCLGITCLDISSSASPSWEGASYLRIRCLLIKALGLCAHCWVF